MFHQSRRVWLIAAAMLCAALAVGSRATPKAQQANTGFPGAVIEDIRFADCAFRGVEASEGALDGTWAN